MRNSLILQSHTHCLARPDNTLTQALQRVYLSNYTNKTTDKKVARLPNSRFAKRGFRAYISVKC
jgi:hypothetical protein